MSGGVQWVGDKPSQGKPHARETGRWGCGADSYGVWVLYLLQKAGNCARPPELPQEMGCGLLRVRHRAQAVPDLLFCAQSEGSGKNQWFCLMMAVFLASNSWVSELLGPFAA